MIKKGKLYTTTSDIRIFQNPLPKDQTLALWVKLPGGTTYDVSKGEMFLILKVNKRTYLNVPYLTKPKVRKVNWIKIILCNRPVIGWIPIVEKAQPFLQEQHV
jgi:hypothetical protein